MRIISRMRSITFELSLGNYLGFAIVISGEARIHCVSPWKVIVSFYNGIIYPQGLPPTSQMVNCMSGIKAHQLSNHLCLWKHCNLIWWSTPRTITLHSQWKIIEWPRQFHGHGTAKEIPCPMKESSWFYCHSIFFFFPVCHSKGKGKKLSGSVFYWVIQK